MPAIQLTITMDEVGAINVNGPIQNQLLCFGLLESAKFAILEHAKQSQRLVQPVQGHLPPQLPTK